jgi:D-alanyl-D-alanine carboxypeptidase
MFTVRGFLTLACVLLGIAMSSVAAVAKPVQSSIVIDVASGNILSSSSPDAVTQPASLTKMMTMYLLFEALQQGKIRLGDSITFSEFAASRPSTNLDVSEGDTIGVETAINAMVVRSANDVATAVGERLAGSEQAFAQKMTAKARQLGMNNTSFHNASGLPDDLNRTTARDMAVLGIALLRDFPKYYPYFSHYTFTYHGVNYTGHNRLVRSFKGADGIKTGYVRASGFNLVTSAEQNGRRLVGVVLGGRSPSVRDRQMATLLQTAFLERNGTGGTLMAKAPDSVGNKAMSDAVATALNDTSAVPDGSDAAEDGGDVAQKSLDPKDSLKAATASDATPKLVGEGDSDELQPILKPGTQLAALTTAPTPAPAAPAPVLAVGVKARQVAVDDQTTANVWKPSAGYGIQVGAYSQYKGAQRAATNAAQSLPKLLSDGRIVIDPQKNAGTTLYRARVVGLSRNDAETACKRLKDCLVVKSENSLAMQPN